MSYAIEYLCGGGLWRPLCASVADTGFALAPHPTFATREEAAEHVAEMRSVGQWRGLRVAEMPRGKDGA